MRALTVAAAVAAAGSATTVYGAPMVVGDQASPFLPGASAVLVIASRALANATAKLQGTEEIPVLTAVEDEAVGPTDDGDGDLAGALDNDNVVPGSVSVVVGATTLSDDGAGVLVDDDDEGLASGTINYVTGAITISDAPTETSVVATYQYTDYGDAWADVDGASVVRTGATTGMTFVEVAALPSIIRAAVTTPSTNGAGAAGLYLLGV
jgi:hypothetical protein